MADEPRRGAEAAPVDRPARRPRRDAGAAQGPPDGAGPAVPDELRRARDEAARAALEQPPARPTPADVPQFFLILTCRDEAHQVELLRRFQGEGLECRALLT
jgi:hypothetical protein